MSSQGDNPDQPYVISRCRSDLLCVYQAYDKRLMHVPFHIDPGISPRITSRMIPGPKEKGHVLFCM